MEEGNSSLGTPIKIPGAVAFTPSPEGAPHFMQMIALLIVTSNNGYTGDLEWLTSLMKF